MPVCSWHAWVAQLAASPEIQNRIVSYVSQRWILSVWSEVSGFVRQASLASVSRQFRLFISDATSFIHRKKRWPITDKLPLIMRACNNSNNLAWRRWACQRVRIAKHPLLGRSRQRWLMFRIKTVSMSTSRARLESFRSLLVHQTVQFMTWRRSHRRHQLNSLSHNRTVITTQMWWGKCRFPRKRVCQCLIKSVRRSTRWTLWQFELFLLEFAFCSHKVLPSFSYPNQLNRLPKKKVRLDDYEIRRRVEVVQKAKTKSPISPCVHA